MRSVRGTLSSLDGVDKVEVDFPSKKATIIMKEGKELDEDTVKDAFADEGKFAVSSFKAE